MLISVAPAKVNLHLGVGGVRTDGYHDVTTVLHALELADMVEIEPAAELTLTCEPSVGVSPENNLAYRAAVALGEAVGRRPQVAIRLIKHIPHGAGLGGGSSDAAAVIAGLATLWGVDPRDPRCIEVAAGLGADVPFFLAPTGCALMTGRGDVLARELPALDGVPVVLVRPPMPVPTAAAYRAFDAAPPVAPDPTRLLVALDAHDASAVSAAIANNMESASASVVPAVADALAWLKQQSGVRGAAVAGSGSAVFALCDTGDAAATIARSAETHGWWGCDTALRGSGVVVTGG